MPVGVVKNARDEQLWEAAKRAAKKGDYQGDSLWKVVMSIYKNMKGERNAKDHPKR